MTMTDNLPTPEAAGRPTRKLRQLSSTQIVFAVILAVGLMLAINFSSRIVADRELQAIQQQVLDEIDLLKREQSDLVAQLEYVQGDAYVEAWARSEGKMVRDGEVLVLPKPSTALLPTPAPVAITVPVNTTLPEPENWHMWWSLFFDTPPPGTGD